jgi:ubiquinone/menaquinone biosynthesis C-methylase UbiE
MLRDRVPTGSVLLDVGGGTGVGSEEAIALARPGSYRQRIVVDPQPGMIERMPASLDLPCVSDAVVGDGSRLPFRDGSIDVLLSIGVLCCMTEDAVPRAVGETWRVLRPGGLAVVSVPLGRGNADDPLFREKGFVLRARLRPGRSLYQRPGSIPPGRTARLPA